MTKTLVNPNAVTFTGRRIDHEAVVQVVVDGVAKPLPLRLDLYNHSRSGPEWGYLGSGPAQLALAMCAVLVEPQLARQVHQQVKERLVAPIQVDEWSLQGQTVMAAIEAARR